MIADLLKGFLTASPIDEQRGQQHWTALQRRWGVAQGQNSTAMVSWRLRLFPFQ
jgi:hypothetical protein